MAQVRGGGGDREGLSLPYTTGLINYYLYGGIGNLYELGL